ncbi:MAG: hypothetical protein WC243_03450 [Patescibacteria group bacterium]|jgi:hypothetical protein
MFYNLPASVSSVSNLVYAIAAIIFLSLLFFFLFLLNIYVLERVSSLIYKKRIESHGETQEQAVALLEDARRQAFEIISEANMKAQDILNKTGSVSSESSAVLKREVEVLHNKHVDFLEGLSKDTISAYQKVTEEEKNKGIEAIGETVSSVEDVASEAITALKTEIDTQRKSYEEFFGENMRKEIDSVRKELDAYRDKKFMEINEQAKSVLKDISKEVLGRALPVEDQEKLVMEALDKAKAMGVFGDE